MSPRPLVGVSSCSKQINGRTWHGVASKYVEAALDAAGVMPLLIPPVGSLAFGADDGTLDRLLDRLDGLLLTGSPSNVEPHHYGQDGRPETLHDAARDATTLPLIRRALETGVPTFAICRGLQEVNVALGGSLHQHVHEIAGRHDHRSPKKADIDVNYAPAHPVTITEGGALHRLLGQRAVDVNSLHSQGIDRLAPPLRVEAVAPDGQIEAVSCPGAAGFFLAVQWHPEHRARQNPTSMKLFDAFADACRRRAGRHTALPLAAE
jgi:putative glutamine amidotransferase